MIITLIMFGLIVSYEQYLYSILQNLTGTTCFCRTRVKLFKIQRQNADTHQFYCTFQSNLNEKKHLRTKLTCKICSNETFSLSAPQTFKQTSCSSQIHLLLSDHLCLSCSFYPLLCSSNQAGILMNPCSFPLLLFSPHVKYYLASEASFYFIFTVLNYFRVLFYSQEHVGNYPPLLYLALAGEE